MNFGTLDNKGELKIPLVGHLGHRSIDSRFSVNFDRNVLADGDDFKCKPVPRLFSLKTTVLPRLRTFINSQRADARAGEDGLHDNRRIGFVRAEVDVGQARRNNLRFDAGVEITVILV